MNPSDIFVLGDKITVYFGDESVGKGSFISLENDVLTWAVRDGDVTFTFTGAGISIKKTS